MLLYTVVAVLGLGLIVARRRLTVFGKAELGGETGMKYLSGFILFFLWVTFITLNSLNAYGVIKNPLSMS